MRKRKYTLLVLIPLLDLTGAAVAGIVLDSGWHVSYVQTGSTVNYFLSSDLSLPTTKSAIRNTDISQTTVSTTVTTVNVSQSNSIRTKTDGGNGSSNGTTTKVVFSVDTDSFYSLSGSFSVNAGDLGTYRVGQEAFLTDVASGVNLYYERDNGYYTGSRTFNLGVREIDPRSKFEGALTGVLKAGALYSLHLRNYILDTAGLTGNGSVTLEITPQTTPVPAPGAAFLALIGLPIVGWVKRWLA